jgi:hypothetical protein
MKTLYLNLKGEYFDQIKSGKKIWEYRLYNDYWRKRLLNGCCFKEWEKIIIRKGYPKAGDPKKEIVRVRRCSVRIVTITHKHFGDDPVKVFAIPVGINNSLKKY